MSTARQLEEYTIADILALPDGERAELISGQLFMMSPPSVHHQRIAVSAITKIKNHIDANHGTCEPFIAPCGLYLYDDDRTYLEPDLMVICDPSKVQEDGVHGAPDWIIEIVSPSSAKMDYSRKLFMYHSAGVRLYWIVDPMKKAVSVHDFETYDFGLYSFGDEIPVAIWPGFSLVIE